MRTVKEVSNLTGISVRTLHYYDEIGLLKPTGKSEAGYRLYDDKALETLQQVLFFREFDISLREIKAIMANPALDRNQILQMQRSMLTTKKERMERLIASIDDILKGENKMDFAVFSKNEMEEMFQTMLEHMPEDMRNIAIKEFGSIEHWKEHYMEAVSSEKMQKGYAKVVEWYGGKEEFLSAVWKVFLDLVHRELFYYDFEKELDFRMNRMAENHRQIYVATELQKTLSGSIRFRSLTDALRKTSCFYLIHGRANYAKQLANQDGNGRDFMLFYLNRSDCMEQIEIYDITKREVLDLIQKN